MYQTVQSGGAGACSTKTHSCKECFRAVHRLLARSTAIAPCEEGDNRHVVLLNLLLSIVIARSVITAIFPDMTTEPCLETAEPGFPPVFKTLLLPRSCSSCYYYQTFRAHAYHHNCQCLLAIEALSKVEHPSKELANSYDVQ